MGLFHTLKFIVGHPLNRRKPLQALTRFVKWQLLCRVSPYPLLYPWVNTSKFLARRGLTGLTGNIYCGLHEFEDMAFVLHFLRTGDWFLDVGANVGSYTILAATAGASVISVEPVPDTFRMLRRNVGVNLFPQEINMLNIGLAERSGTLFFTNHLDTVNHVVPDGTPNAQPIQVSTLDELCVKSAPGLIKMDVEGYEREVLEGGSETLKLPSLKAVIVELNDSSRRYGGSAEEIISRLHNAGFAGMRYDPWNRNLTTGHATGLSGNGLFIRDVEFVRQRLNDSEKYRVNGVSL